MNNLLFSKLGLFVAALVIGAVIYTFFVSAISVPETYDQYWHLKTGTDLLERNLSPLVDHYSFSHEGQAIKQQPYLFQLLFAKLVQVSDYGVGTVYLKLVLSVLILATLGWLLLTCRPPLAPTLLGILLTAYFVQQRLVARPELIDYAFVITAFTLYWRANQQFSPSRMLQICLFCVVWINYHAGILPFVIFFGLYLDRFVQLLKQATRSDWLTFWISGFIIVGLGFANKDLQHPLVYALNFSPVWDNIAEHQPSINKLDTHQLLVAYWLSGFSVVGWSLLTRNWGLAAVAAVFLYASFDRVRMLSLSGVAIACAFILLAADERSRQLFQSLKVSVRTLISVFTVSAVVALMSALTWVANVSADYQREFPADIVQYLNASESGGNVFNIYRQGGYLLNYLNDDYRIFIDGRTEILYPDHFYAFYTALARGDRQAFDQLNARYDIDYAIWPFEKAMNKSIPRELGFKAEYIGTDNVLYSASGRLQAISEALLFPACQQSLNAADLQSALTVMSSQAPVNTALIDGFRLIGNDAITVEAVAAFGEKHAAGVWRSTDPILRLIAHRLILDDAPSLAAKTFATISQPDTLDALYAIHSHLLADETDEARSLLVQLISGAWENPKRKILPPQVLKIEALYERLVTQGGSNPATDGLADEFFAAREIPDIPEEFTQGGFVYRGHCDSMTSSD